LRFAAYVASLDYATASGGAVELAASEINKGNWAGTSTDAVLNFSVDANDVI
jgi:hypothetical protein